MGKPKEGINYLAKVIDNRSKQVIRGDACSDISIELGTKKENGIKVDSFSKIIKDYLICKGVEAEENDRVLVAWIDSDICVIGVIDGKEDDE